jgi:hypothetical protein
MYAYQDFTLNLELDDSEKYLTVRGTSAAGEFQERVKFAPPAVPYQDRWPWDEYESRQVEASGAAIYNLLFPGVLRDALSKAIARLPESGVLRIWINFSQPPLAAIPWELALDPGMGFLALDTRTPILRSSPDWSQAQQAVKLAPAQTLSILVAYPAPTDFPALNLEREKAELSEALEIPEARGQIKLTFLQPPITVDALVEALQNGEYDVLQISGHGGVDDKGHKGLIYLEDQNRFAHPIGPEQFRVLLQGLAYVPRLVSVIALDSAFFGLPKSIDSLVPAVLQAGVAAYLGLQGGIMDDTAIRLVRTFYAQIADGLPLERALTEARRTIFFNARSTLEWVIPTLYSLQTDTTMFIPGRLEKPSRTGQSIVNVGGAVISGAEVIKTSGVQINVSQTVQSIEAGGEVVGVEFGTAQISQQETLSFSLEDIDPLIIDLKDAIASEASLTPKDRIKSLTLAEQLRWELVAPQPDMEQITALERRVAMLGTRPAQVMDSIHKKLSLG